MIFGIFAFFDFLFIFLQLFFNFIIIGGKYPLQKRTVQNILAGFIDQRLRGGGNTAEISDALLKSPKGTFKALDQHALHKVEQVALLHELPVALSVQLFNVALLVFKRPVDSAFEPAAAVGAAAVRLTKIMRDNPVIKFRLLF